MAVAQVKEVSYTLLQARDEGEDTRGNALCRSPLPLQLLDNRPDVRVAEYLLAQAFYATNVARASFYPSISLSGRYGWTNSAEQALAQDHFDVIQSIIALHHALGGSK